MKKFVALVMLNTLLLTISAWKCTAGDPIRFQSNLPEYSIHSALHFTDL